MADNEQQSTNRYYETPQGWIRVPSELSDKDVLDHLEAMGVSIDDAKKVISTPHTQAGMIGGRVAQAAGSLGKQAIGGLADTIGGAVDVLRPTKIGPEPLESGKPGKGPENWSPTDTSADISKLFGVSPPQGPAENLTRQAFGTALGGLAAKGPAAVKAFYGLAPGALGYLGDKVGEWAGPVASDAGLIPSGIGNAVGPAAQIAATLFAPQFLGGKITPNPTDSRRIKAAKTVEGAGIDVTAGNLTGNPKILGAESVADPRIAQRQHGQFGNYLAKQAGAEGSIFDTGPGGFFETQEARLYNPRFANTQPYFNDLSGIQSRSLANDRSKLLDVIRDAVGFTPSPGATPGSELTSALSRGMDARQYYALRSALASEAATVGQTNPRYASMVNDVMGAMDRSMGQQNPQAAGMPPWAQQEEQYRILEKAREQGATPEPDPSQIKRAEQTVSGYPRMKAQTSPNAGVLEALDLMAKPPDDAAKNYWAHSNQSGIAKGVLGGLTSGAVAHLMGHEMATPMIAGAMITGGIPKIGDYVRSKVAMTPPMQSYWKNQMLPTGPGYLDPNWMTLQALMMKPPFDQSQPQSQQSQSQSNQ